MSWLGQVLSYSSALALALTLASIVGYLFRDAIQHWLFAKIDQANEERTTRLEAALSRSASSMEAFEQHLLARATAGESHVIQKRLEAAVELWRIHCELREWLYLASFLDTLSFENFDKRVGEPGIKSVIDGMAGKLQPDSFTRFSQAEVHRPFVSTLSWAYFSAHLALLTQCAAVWQVWKLGMSAKELVDQNATRSLLLSALPDQREQIDKLNMSGNRAFLDDLHSKLAQEIRRTMVAAEEDQEATKRASEIIKSGNKLADLIRKKQEKDLKA